MSKRKSVAPKSSKGRPPTLDEIVNGVVGKLKPDMDQKLADVKKDVEEKLKSPGQTPNVGVSPYNVDQLKSMLKGFGVKDEELTQLDGILSKVGAGSGSMNNPMMMFGKDGQIPDLNKLSDGQLKFLQQQQAQQMLPMIIPLFANQQNPMMAEMTQRIFMEKINFSTWMERMQMGQMARMMGRPDLYEKYLATSEKYLDPIVDPSKYNLDGTTPGAMPAQSSIGQPVAPPVMKEPNGLKDLSDKFDKLMDKLDSLQGNQKERKK